MGEKGNCQQISSLSDTERLSTWSDLRTKNRFTDAILVCSDGVSFPVHKVILAGCSEFFRAMFTNPMKECDKENHILQNVHSEEMAVVLKYIYERQLDITSENVTKLLQVADFLTIMDIHQACVDTLKKSLSPTNCLKIRSFARDHFLEDLEREAQLYLLRKFPLVAEQSMDILSLPVDELVPLFASDLLNVRDEEIIWRFVLRWVDHDKENRHQHLFPLLKCIRMGLMEVQYFLENVKSHPYIVDNELCQPVVIDTLKVLMDVETIAQRNEVVHTPECARPRIPHEVLFAIGGWSGGSPTKTIETYDTRADRWIKVEEEDPMGPRAYHGTAIIGFDIYVIGGFDGMENFNSCRCFNVQEKTWKEIAPMHERRCYVSVAVLDDIIYAMGGYNGHHRQNTAEKYDFKSNQWTSIAPMHLQRSDASATVLNGKIYITGGFDGRECLSTAEVYDPANNTWALLPPMRSRRSGVSCIAYHDSIYVLGGFNGMERLCSVEKYTPATNQWSQVPDMYVPRSNFAIEVIDDMVFAIGGFNGAATIHQVECFDEHSNEWYEATDMNIFRSALSACVVTDLPNINDYIHQNRDMLMEEKRQKLMALREANNEMAAIEPFTVHVGVDIIEAIEEVNNTANNNDDDNNNNNNNNNMDVEDNANADIVD